ncbi:MAG: hypothetical protein PHO32_09480 [Candidatus Cloacimonetes bacterium]|nr:hypothetical protein [Candidatus Cloacimonadota bacterium]
MAITSFATYAAMNNGIAIRQFTIYITTVKLGFAQEVIFIKD